MASILSPDDQFGCKLYTKESVQNLLCYVYGPVLFLRFLGTIFMNKPQLIIYQIIIIYSYLTIALTTWDFSTLSGLHSLPSACFKPMHMSMLNIILMCIFYVFVLMPFYTIIILLPYYLYQVYKYAEGIRQKKLLKHYLVKAMPSVVFNRKLFDIEECAICMETFKEGQDHISPLLCDERHYFHSDCIEEWLVKKNECPLCKVQQTPKSMREFSNSFKIKAAKKTAETELENLL